MIFCTSPLWQAGLAIPVKSNIHPNCRCVAVRQYAGEKRLSRQLSDSIKEVENIIERLEKLKPSDRLEAISNINECLEAVQGMINGFSFWIKTPEFMSLFNEKETFELFTSIRKVTIETLKIGVKYAQLIASNSKVNRDLEYLI